MHRRILYASYTNLANYPPLEHSSEILADAGWQVLMMGTRHPGPEEIRSPAHDHIEERYWTFYPAGLWQKVHYLLFCAGVLLAAIRWRVGWLYLSDQAVTPVACVARYIPGLRVVYHEHDTASGSGGLSVFQRLMQKTRNATVRTAEICVWPNLRRAEISAPHRRDAIIVWNCPRRQEAALPRTTPAAGVGVFYHGSINAARLPATVVEALALLPADFRLTIAGYETLGSVGHIAQLFATAERLGVAQRVRYLGEIPYRADLMAECRKADIGLAFMPLDAVDINEANMTGASNKPFDYLACGLALLVSDRPDWRAAVVDTGLGLTCDPRSATSIAAALRQLSERPKDMRKMGERGRQRVLAEWNYEAQFRPVLDRLET